MLAVTVNDKPLAVSAIVERGRVLLPMRATFTALGATVSYDGRARAVVARNATHTLRLPVSTLRMVANHAYVPLRFVAQAMGAFVTYSARTRIVSVTTTSDAPATVRVTALDPPDGASVSTAYPTISATLDGENAARGDVTLRIDGTDVSELSSFDGSTITFMPRRGFSRGSHQVVFAGRTASGHAFSAQWSFATTLAAPPDAGPAMSSNYGYRFYVNGLDSFYPGNWMHFVLVAPPGGSAVLQLCNLGYQYAFWNGGFGTTYQANVLAPYGYWVPSCQVTAIYTAWNGVQTYVPLPLFIGLYTNPAYLTPIAGPPGWQPNIGPGSARPVPRAPRRPEVIATPAHAVVPNAAAPHVIVPPPQPHPIRIPPAPVPHPRASP